MKKAFQFLLVIIICFLVVSYFIPVVRQEEIPVSNTLANIVSSIFQPKNWIKWNPIVKEAWLKDSSKCKFQEDSSKQTVTITIPGKQITIYRESYLLYKLEEVADAKNSSAVLSIIPFMGNPPTGSNYQARIAYGQNTRLIFKIFPFLEKNLFTKKSIDELKSYLEDPTLFYGFPISIKQTSDTLFLTSKQILNQQEFFKKLPVVFDSLDSYARASKLEPGNRNVYYQTLSDNSLEILAGININKIVEPDSLYTFMHIPAVEYIVIAHFEGRFGDRARVYGAINKYVADNQLIRIGVSFEKYLSPLPVSDSSVIRMDLCYPLRYY